MLRNAALAALALAAWPAIPGSPSPFAPLAAGRELGVAAVHVETGRTESFGADARFVMASTVKLPLAVAVLRAADRGSLDENAVVTIRRGDLRHGMGVRLGPGTYGVRRLLEAMLQESDNTATDALFRLVGGTAGVRGALAEAGIAGIDVSRTEKETFAAYRRGRMGKDGRDTATPDAMARLLVKLQSGQLLSPARTAELLGWMRGCRTGDARIRAGVPKGTPVADKTGTMEPVIGDVGIVTLPDGTHVALAVYVRGGPDPERAIADAARETWRLFARK